MINKTINECLVVRFGHDVVFLGDDDNIAVGAYSFNKSYKAIFLKTYEDDDLTWLIIDDDGVLFWEHESLFDWEE